MAAILLDGKSVARLLEFPLREGVTALRRVGVVPGLAVLYSGHTTRAAANAQLKADACQRTGLSCTRIEIESSRTTDEVLREIERLNADRSIHGIFLQYPLDPRIDERRCCDYIATIKDVDGAGVSSLGQHFLGGKGFGVATPEGVMALLSHYGIEVAGRRAVVVGRGVALAKPMALQLLQRDATVTLCAADAPGLREVVRDAEIIVGACGLPQWIRADWIPDQAIIIDLGFHRSPQRSGPSSQAVGDVEMTPDLMRRCAAWTPVPGGAGPMTVAALLLHTVAAAEQAGSAEPT